MFNGLTAENSLKMKIIKDYLLNRSHHLCIIHMQVIITLIHCCTCGVLSSAGYVCGSPLYWFL